jgi:dephospho-CoA kinase
MLRAAITGNIGSGKTTVCKIFESLGVPVFYADAEAKRIYDEEEVRMQVKEIFGEDVYDKQQQLIRQKLAGRVFRNAKALQQLNAIIHPRLMQRYLQWLSAHPDDPYTLHEAAVIFENHLEKQFDYIITVSCPESIRMERIRKRDGLPGKEIKNRMTRQWPDEQKERLSQAVIRNDGQHFLIPQVLEIHRKLTRKNKI